MSVGGQKGKQGQSGFYSGETETIANGSTQGAMQADPTQAWLNTSDILGGNLGNTGLNQGQQFALNNMQQWAQDKPFQTSAGIINNMLMPQASQSAHQAAASGPVQSGNIASMMGQFNNPWTQSVVDATAADATNALQTGLNEIDARYGGQYGNGRAGVATGQAVGDFTRGLASNIGQIRSQGFNTALGGAQAQAGNDLSASNANTGYEQQRNFFNTQQQNIADQRQQSVLQQILGNVGATQDANVSANQGVYDMAGGGNANFLNFLNSQVPAFGQTSNQTTNETTKGKASGTSQSSGGSSSKGGGVKLFG